MQIVLIKWIDAETTGDTAWQNLEEIKTDALKAPPIMSTVGFLIHDCETHVAVVDTYGPEDCSMMHRIPKEMIKSVSNLFLEGDNPYAI
jgi:histidinol dehydrogenase